jgi:hypothetical protein
MHKYIYCVFKFTDPADEAFFLIWSNEGIEIMSSRYFFDDDNYAYERMRDGSICYFLYPSEQSLLSKAIDKLPITNIEIITRLGGKLLVRLDNDADEAYFKILTADGVEI